MILNDADIKRLIADRGLVSGHLAIAVQLQPNGFDLTVGAVHAVIDDLQSAGRIDFDNTRRRVPPHSKVEPACIDGRLVWRLAPGTYMVESAETLSMPGDLAAVAVPRSTLTRCGATLTSAAIDAGYCGRLVFPVTLATEVDFECRARFAQVVFHRLTGPAKRPYAGIYGEKK